MLFGLGLPWLGRCATVDAATCPPQAAVPTPQQLSDAAAHAVDHGFLWRIRRDGHDSFLFGTVHVARFEWMFPGPTVLQAMQSADTVALELDLLDPDIVRRMRSGSMTTSAPLPPALAQRLRDRGREECVPEQAFAPDNLVVPAHPASPVIARPCSPLALFIAPSRTLTILLRYGAGLAAGMIVAFSVTPSCPAVKAMLVVLFASISVEARQIAVW